jgi:hypothetical protein
MMHGGKNIKLHSAVCLFCDNGAKILLGHSTFVVGYFNAVKVHILILRVNIPVTGYKYFGNSASISSKTFLCTVKVDVRYSSDITLSEAYEKTLLTTKFTEEVVFLSTRFPSIH